MAIFSDILHKAALQGELIDEGICGLSGQKGWFPAGL